MCEKMCEKPNKGARQRVTCHNFMVHALDGVLDYSENRVKVICEGSRYYGKLVGYTEDGFHFETERGMTLLFDFKQILELRFSSFFKQVTIKLAKASGWFSTGDPLCRWSKICRRRDSKLVFSNP